MTRDLKTRNCLAGCFVGRFTAETWRRTVHSLTPPRSLAAVAGRATRRILLDLSLCRLPRFRSVRSFHARKRRSLYGPGNPTSIAVWGSPNGLTTAAAEEIRTKTGTNTVAVGGRHSVLLDLLHRCRNPLIVQLLIIAVVYFQHICGSSRLMTFLRALLNQALCQKNQPGHLSPFRDDVANDLSPLALCIHPPKKRGPADAGHANENQE